MMVPMRLSILLSSFCRLRNGQLNGNLDGVCEQSETVAEWKVQKSLGSFRRNSTTSFVPAMKAKDGALPGPQNRFSQRRCNLVNSVVTNRRAININTQAKVARETLHWEQIVPSGGGKMTAATFI